MKSIKEFIEEKSTSTLADCMHAYKDIAAAVSSGSLKFDRELPIALLSSFTIKGLKECIAVSCAKTGVLARIYEGPYNQVSQEILNKKSGLYDFKPALVFIAMDVDSLLGNLALLPYSVSSEERKKTVDSKLHELFSLIDILKSGSTAKIVLHNFLVPNYSPLGILEEKQEFGLKDAVKAANAKLREKFLHDSQVFIFDYDSFCSEIGKSRVSDAKMLYLGDIRHSLEQMPALARSYMAYIKPACSLTKKCIVLDLDNTLWGGVVGEEGIDKIKLGPTNEGRPFVDFQKGLLALFQRGVILAIDSNNNPDDALQVIRKHPSMVLREDNFASMQINWNDKVSKLKDIAEELNIGLDSLVFIDDDPLNRAMVKGALPEVLVVDMPEDPAQYLRTLMALDDFNTFQLTEEDVKKGAMYIAQRKRQEFEKSATDVTAYLKELDLTVTVAEVTASANRALIPRISQLTQKTNQFNVTTKRYLEEEISKLASSDSHMVVAVRVEDKFGDNGWTGVAIVEKKQKQWTIDNFLLSCRVLGRKVENIMLAFIIKKARKSKINTLEGELIYTKKNAPAHSFFKDHGFSNVLKDDLHEVWRCHLNEDLAYLDFIKVVES